MAVRASGGSRSLGGWLSWGAGVGRDVAVLVDGLVQVQNLPVDLQRHAAAIEGCDRGRGRWHIWAAGEEQTRLRGRDAWRLGPGLPALRLQPPRGHGFPSLRNPSIWLGHTGLTPHPGPQERTQIVRSISPTLGPLCLMVKDISILSLFYCQWF